MGECIERQGVLILVAGPSGSGKDTLIAAARRSLAHNSAFVFPARLITRPHQCGGERHIAVSLREFEAMRTGGQFFLDWDAHGYSYGVPAAIAGDLELGRTVVLNVSRRMIRIARSKWRHTHVISLTVAPEILRERLRARGRETEAEIQARVVRASDESCAICAPVHMLDNSVPLDRAASEFLDLLKRLSPALPAEPMPAYLFERAAAIGLP